MTAADYGPDDPQRRDSAPPVSEDAGHHSQDAGHDMAGDTPTDLVADLAQAQ